MNTKVFWGALIIIMIGFGFIFTTQKQSDTTLSRDDVKTIEGLKEYDNLEKKHVQVPVTYPQSPGVGGDHHPTWIACDQKSYDVPVQNEKAVHALEHGAVWITHLPSLEKSKIDALKQIVKTSPATFLTPFAEQKSPIVLSAWGKQLEVNDVNDPRIDQFLVKFRKGPQAPEPGATCSSPEGPDTVIPPTSSQPVTGGGGLAPSQTPMGQ